MKYTALITSSLTVLLAACAAGPGEAPRSGRGLVTGVPGSLAGLTVCVDRNAAARCAGDAPSARTDASGAFDLPGSGALVVDLVDVPGSAGPLVLRSPTGSGAVLSPVSTELAAMIDAGTTLTRARTALARRIGVPEALLLAAPASVSDASVRAALEAENRQLLPRIAAAVTEAGATGPRSRSLRNRLALEAIDTVVVIYAENRAFDTMYGLFPGANGIPGRNPGSTGPVHPQKDFDGTALPVLPPAWGGLTANGQPITMTQAQTTGMANQAFQIDDPKGLNGSGVVVAQSVTTRDLVHRYYNNMMQINGGRNDAFAAYSDAGALTMGYYDGSRMALWQLAQRYTLADNFFMGAFGGSFLNHQYLVCGCAPTYPNADAPQSPARDLIAQIETDAQGNFVRLAPAADMPRSVLAGAPRYARDGALTPKDASGMFHAVNTMQPPYQPSGVPPAASGDARYGDAAKPVTLPPQTQRTIGDTLDAKGVSWAWYSGAWDAAGAGTPEARKLIYGGAAQFQPHHQPFNYYASFDPATRASARAAHLKDFDASFLTAAAAGILPSVSFYKPQGNLNQHAGYANVADGDAHIANVIAQLQKSPQWGRMLIVVTYDENGGFYDHAAVPKGDRWGPGTRIPALVISPFAKRGFVDKTQYDTGSILRFITHRWSLPPVPGITLRDEGLRSHGSAPMGDLTGALDFTQ